MEPEKLKRDAALRREIASDEGERHRPYRDTRGNWTAGIGHSLTAHGVSRAQIVVWIKSGVPEETIREWFEEDMGAAIHCCSQVFEGFAGLPDEAQRVLVNMGFDLMYGLWDWGDLRRDIEAKEWKRAGADILHSGFAAEAPERCRRLASRMGALARSCAPGNSEG